MPSGMDASLEEAGIIIAWTSPASNDMSSYRSDLTWEGTWQTSARVYNRLGKAKAELAIAIHPIPVHYSWYAGAEAPVHCSPPMTLKGDTVPQENENSRDRSCKENIATSRSEWTQYPEEDKIHQENLSWRSL